MQIYDELRETSINFGDMCEVQRGEFAEVWENKEAADCGELHLARRCIIQAVQDNAVDWFLTDLAELFCTAVGLDAALVRQHMLKRRAA